MSRMMERCMRNMQSQGCPESMGRKFGGPQEMFRTMMGNVQEDDRLAKYATKELRCLFNDWLLQLEEEVISLSDTQETLTPEMVAESFKISIESATFILDRLAQKQDPEEK